jgi:UDP-N-acetylmuramoylalanine--D-glutamate ligase
MPTHSKAELIQKLKSSNIHVIGIAGIEGSDIALFLDHIGCPKDNITLHQLSPADKLEQDFFKYNQGFPESELKERFSKLLNSGFKFNFDKDYLNNIQEADIIFAPQSWFLHDSNAKLFELKDKISTITNLYFHLIPCPIISVTGSNGKSTTTKLIYELINQSTQHKAWITGNDRQTPSLLLKLDDIKPTDYLVTETSNRQLNFLENHKPFISVITNITPNHVNEYKNYQEYIQTKLKLFQNQTKDDHLVINLDNQVLNQLHKENIKPQLHTVSTISENTDSYLKNNIIYHQNQKIISTDEVNLIGIHNYYNIMQAITVAKILDIPNQEIKKTLQNFYGLTNRCQIVHKSNNLIFINDRQGTAIDATVQALKSLPKPIIIILGGTNKGMQIDPLIDQLNHPQVTTIGINSPFVEEIKNKTHKLIQVNSMTQAIKQAIQITQADYPKQTTHILFSPACEYGPYFNPLPEHSDAENFNQIVKDLTQ